MLHRMRFESGALIDRSRAPGTVPKVSQQSYRRCGEAAQFLSGAVVEVTDRTIKARFLLVPSPELGDVVLGVLGLARRHHRGRLWLSNAASEGSKGA